MSGHERSKFVTFPQSIEEEFTCGICLNILNNPMTTPCCRHSYCKQCILQSLQMSSNPNTCPNDRQKLLSKDLITASRVVTNILDKQEVYCDYKPYGCPQTCLLSQLPQHLIQCCFDPNKSSIKCNQLLQNLSQSVDKLKNKIKQKEFEVLKKQMDGLNKEIKVMASKTSSKTVYLKPSTETFKNKVMESAKNNIETHELIETNIEIQSLKKKVVKKCKEGILRSSDYNQIAQYLVDCLNNDEYEWSAFVYPKHSSVHSLGNYVYKMELSFGDLCILVVSHYSQDDDDDDNYSDVGDDYLDYSDDIGDDDEEEEEVWDWTQRTNGF